MGRTDRLRAAASVYGIRIRAAVVSLVQLTGLGIAVVGTWDIFWTQFRIRSEWAASVPSPPTEFSFIDAVLVIAVGLVITYYPSRPR